MNTQVDIEAVLKSLRIRKNHLRKKWFESKPFYYLCIDNFLPIQMADNLLRCYPNPQLDGWIETNYTTQINKQRCESGFPEPIDEFFSLTAMPEFTRLISEITDINNLIPDPNQIGGGMHQILPGGFLDVHIDFNFHPELKLHRQLNLLLYLNKDWKREYEGCLELWDMKDNKQIENIAPVFNRAILFNTNQISYHGHPKPFKAPAPITRKSLAVYYYTKERDDEFYDATEHNTIYKNTSGLQGVIKTLFSTLHTFSDRLREKNVTYIFKSLLKKCFRKIKGLPPENQ